MTRSLRASLCCSSSPARLDSCAKTRKYANSTNPKTASRICDEHPHPCQCIVLGGSDGGAGCLEHFIPHYILPNHVQHVEHREAPLFKPLLPRAAILGRMMTMTVSTQYGAPAKPSHSVLKSHSRFRVAGCSRGSGSASACRFYQGPPRPLALSALACC